MIARQAAMQFLAMAMCLLLHLERYAKGSLENGESIRGFDTGGQDVRPQASHTGPGEIGELEG